MRETDPVGHFFIADAAPLARILQPACDHAFKGQLTDDFLLGGVFGLGLHHFPDYFFCCRHVTSLFACRDQHGRIVLHRHRQLFGTCNYWGQTKLFGQTIVDM